MTVITRFPPSPTGMMHIGNARTALFNYLYARHTGGKFVIRIEDTDRARHSEEAVQVIMDALDWLGLDYDNTPTSQYANKDRHTEVAQQMLAKGNAYKCYCTAEELQMMRDTMKEDGRIVAYNNKWRDVPESEAPESTPYVVRIKSPLEGHTLVSDEVQGEVKVENKQLDDMIILRSDGTPTYMLAVVVDDHDMGITHVIRGDDHLNNTFRQNVIYDLMDWDKPAYAHLPLIHGPTQGKLSKRHGAVGVNEFKEMGYLPESLCNYLLKLGWAHGDDEIINMSEAIKLFDFDGINKSAAKFDYAKLESLNAHYIGVADNARLLDLVQPFLLTQHGIEMNETQSSTLLSGMNSIKERAKTLVQLADEAMIYLVAPTEYNEKAQKQLNDESSIILKALKEKLNVLDEFKHDVIEAACKATAEEKAEGKLGKVMMPLRAALSGTDKSPALYEATEVLGKDEVVSRIQAAIDYIG